MCFVFIWEQTATCATYSINWLVFITEMKRVYSAVWTGSLNKAVCASSLKGYVEIGWKYVSIKMVSQKWRYMWNDNIRHLVINYFIFSVYIAQFEEYTLPLINHLVSRKVGHWDTVIRELTAKVNLLLFLHVHVYIYVYCCNTGNGIFHFETVFS